jgi:N-acetylneuraminate synthase
MGHERGTYIIAEAGVNHNGSLDLAKRLIEVAAEAGADAVKFQTFQAEKITSKSAPKATYQVDTTGSLESQYEMLRRLELDTGAHQTLMNHCRSCRIQFLSTPFDLESLALLAKELDLPYLKISSGEVTNAPFLLEAARYGKPIILSTGMCTLNEVETALGVIAYGYLGGDEPPAKSRFSAALNSPEGRTLLKNRLTLLHCTTEYPAPFAEINLRVMDTLTGNFGLAVGLSDHSAGIAVAIAAVARGAAMIEKHFTLDKSLPGPDHKASIEPDELQRMVQSIRQIEQALGSSEKVPTASELKNRSIVRRSLTAARDINAGEIFTPENLVVKRPGTGINPIEYWEYLGKVAARDYHKDEMVKP